MGESAHPGHTHPGLHEFRTPLSSYALGTLFTNDATAKVTYDNYLTANGITDDTPTEVWPPGINTVNGDFSLANTLIPVNETTGDPLSDPTQWGAGEYRSDSW